MQLALGGRGAATSLVPRRRFRRVLFYAQAQRLAAELLELDDAAEGEDDAHDYNAPENQPGHVRV